MLNPKYVLEFSKWGKSDDQTSFLKFLNRQAQPFKKNECYFCTFTE